MSQIVIYKGVRVTPVDRSGNRIRVQTRNPADAAKADIPFKTMDGSTAVFEALVAEDELVPVDL